MGILFDGFKGFGDLFKKLNKSTSILNKDSSDDYYSSYYNPYDDPHNRSKRPKIPKRSRFTGVFSDKNEYSNYDNSYDDYDSNNKNKFDIVDFIEHHREDQFYSIFDDEYDDNDF